MSLLEKICHLQYQLHRLQSLLPIFLILVAKKIQILTFPSEFTNFFLPYAVQMWRLWPCFCNLWRLFQMCIGGNFTTSKINKMSCRILLAFYAGLLRADLPASWHYKGLKCSSYLYNGIMDLIRVFIFISFSFNRWSKSSKQQIGIQVEFIFFLKFSCLFEQSIKLTFRCSVKH